jgi:hypothetical protein
VVSPNKTNKSPKKTAKGKGKAVGSDVGPDTDEEGRVAPSRRPLTARQGTFQKNSNYYKNLQADKARRERQAAFSAEHPLSDEDAEPKTTTKPKKEPASKKPAPKKAAPAATKSSASSTIQDGRIKKAANVKNQPQRPKRNRDVVDYGNESVSDASDEEQLENKTTATLRETVDRHARWCPFVRINKKLHRMYRKAKLRGLPDYEDNNETTEPEEVHDEDDDTEAESEEDESDAKSVDGEDTHASKKKPTAKKTVTKKPALKKGTAGEAATTKALTLKAASSKKAKFDLPEEREESSDGREANNDSETEATEPDESEDDDGAMAAAATAAAFDSDEQLSSLDDDKVEQLQEAHEHEQKDLNEQASDPSSNKDAVSQKRRADLEAGQGKMEPAKKQRRST